MEIEHSAEYVCVGGVFNGQRHACEGRRLIVSLVTEDYTRQYGEWQQKYGVAWAIEILDGIPEHPKTPPPPPYPTQVYYFDMAEDGEPILRHFDGDVNN